MQSNELINNLPHALVVARQADADSPVVMGEIAPGSSEWQPSDFGQRGDSQKTWSAMNDHERYFTLSVMRDYGSGFVGRLAEAWLYADAKNAAALAEAFPGLVARYGPGSTDYEAYVQLGQPCST